MNKYSFWKGPDPKGIFFWLFVSVFALIIYLYLVTTRYVKDHTSKAGRLFHG